MSCHLDSKSFGAFNYISNFALEIALYKNDVTYDVTNDGLIYKNQGLDCIMKTLNSNF